MRILLVVHRVPWPPVKGDKIRSWRWVEALSGLGEVSLGTLAESREELEAAEEIRERVSELAVFRRPRAPAAARALFSGRSFSEEVFRSRALLDWVGRTFAERQPDVAIAFSSTTAQYLEGRPGPRVMDLVDVDSAKWARYGRERFPRPLWRTEGRRLDRCERRILDTWDRVLVVSGPEAERLADPRGVVEVLPNGVDVDAFAPPPGGARDPGAIVFTGAMDYPPNVDAAVWFAERVLPRIREEWGDAEFRIVGSNPARRIRDLQGLPGVVVTGTVPDVRPWLHAASVAVAPLRIAMGVQNKVLEAMAAAVPVVATPGAAEGLEVEPGTHLVVAEDDSEFARAVIGLLADAERSRRVAEAGRERVTRKYRWEPVMERMKEIAREAVARGDR